MSRFQLDLRDTTNFVNAAALLLCITPQRLGHIFSSEDGLSPLAPGPLADHWSSGGAQPAGFDHQASLNSAETSDGISPGDIWGEDEEEMGLGDERKLLQQQQQGQGQQQRHRVRGVRPLNWDDKLPGETIITQSVRLYLSSLHHDASHEENCALVLHQVGHVRSAPRRHFFCCCRPIAAVFVCYCALHTVI